MNKLPNETACLLAAAIAVTCVTVVGCAPCDVIDRIRVVLQPGAQELDVAGVEEMQKAPPDDYLEQLRAVVEEGTDPYVRERAIFALTDIAVRRDETEEVIDFLKQVALDEKNDNVRSAAYANLDLIKELYPAERKGSLQLCIAGDIRKGSDVKLIATISSKVDVEAIVSIDYLHVDIQAVSAPFHKVALRGDEPAEVEFELRLTQTGEYFIPVTLMLSFDRVDYELIEDGIQIRVGEDWGEVISYPEQ